MSRFMKVVRTVPLRFTQNSLMNINSSVPMTVRVVPQWRDDGVVQLEELVTTEGDRSKIRWNIQENAGKKVGLSSVDLSIFYSDKCPSDVINETICYFDDRDEHMHEKIDKLVLTATVPEKCNFQCRLDGGGDIIVQGKLEAEDGFSFITKGGSITVDKLRGNDIYLETSNFETKCGVINIRKSCEAQNLSILVGKRGRLRAKMLNVSNSVIEVQDSDEAFEPFDIDDATALIDISSIYTSLSGQGIFLTVKRTPEMPFDESFRKVRVKSCHGHISVRASSSFSTLKQPVYDFYDQRIGYIELGGINGSFDVSLENLEKDMICKSESCQLPLAAKIHVESLSQNQVNLLTSDFGDVSITLDRKLESDIRLFSSKCISKLKPDLLLEEDENLLINSLKEIDLEIEKSLSDIVESSTNQKKRIITKTKSFTDSSNHTSGTKYIEYVHGRIENKSNEPDSRFETKNKAGGKIRIDGAAGQALHGFSGGKNEGKDLPPLLCVATDGEISMESLSWFGAISKRYGIDRENVDLGRQVKAGSSNFHNTGQNFHVK